MSVIFKRGFHRAVAFLAKSKCEPIKKGCGPTSENRPKRPRCVVGPSGVHPAVEGGYKAYRNISLFVCIPVLLMVAYNVATTYKEPERVPFRKYEFLRIRTKKFFWSGGNTDKSFFHNKHLNALPDGYEDDDE